LLIVGLCAASGRERAANRVMRMTCFTIRSIPYDRIHPC
jgi:hypothetical protein